MAKYGRIHIGSRTNDIKFENVAARREFEKQFEVFHTSHDHDGDAPTFEEINAKDVSTSVYDTRVREWGDPYLTIEGYQAREIFEYHRWDGVDRISSNPRYRPPNCCISPLIVLETVNIGNDGPFVDSGKLERHRLSSVFRDVSDEDFENLVESVKKNGFIDPHIRIYQGKILDGWHRYRAALELNLVRKLRFTVWDEKKEGYPQDFVIARNINRRHLTPRERADIVVEAYKILGRGNVKSQQDSDVPTGTPKSRKELAEISQTSVRTVSRAVKGQQEKALWEQINTAIPKWKKKREGVGHASKTMLIHATLRFMGLPHGTETNIEVLKELLQLLTSEQTNILETLVRKQLQGDSLWGTASIDPKAAEQSEPDNLDTLWNTFHKRIPKWKEKYAESGYKENALIQAATEDELIQAFVEYSKDAPAIGDPLIVDADGNLTGEGIEELIHLMKRASYPYAKTVRRLMRDRHPELAQEVQTDAGTEGPESEPELTPDEELFKAAADAETAKPTQTAEEREANKLRKRQRQLCKMLWDTRKEISQFYLGDADNDLNLSLSLPELERGFVRNNPAYESNCNAALHRTSFNSLNIVVEKTIELNTDLPTLEAELKALQTYRGDILNWKRLNWSPDTNWILPLIEAKKSKAETQKTVPEKEQREAQRLAIELDGAHGKAEDTRKRVWDAFHESDLLENVSKANFAIAAAKHHNRYEDGYGSAENYLLGEDYAPINQLNLKEAQAMCEFFASVAAEIQEPADWIEALADGLAGVDVSALRNTVSAALEALGESDMNWDFKGRLSADLNNVFLEYENVPTTKECVIALLDAADTLLSEFDKE